MVAAQNMVQKWMGTDNSTKGKNVENNTSHKAATTWLQLAVVTDFSGQMLTSNGHCYAGEVRSSQMNPGLNCTGQMADSMYGVVSASGLLMSMLWTACPMVALGLWYGQAKATDNEHNCILSMAIWMHWDTVTRSWGPLSCHSSAAITSCFSMIMHGPMSQGSVQNSWKQKMSQFFHDLYTHQTCHPLSMLGSLWINVYDSVSQFLPISSNFATAIEEEWDNIPQATINSLIKMCCTAWGK